MRDFFDDSAYFEHSELGSSCFRQSIYSLVCCSLIVTILQSADLGLKNAKASQPSSNLILGSPESQIQMPSGNFHLSYAAFSVEQLTAEEAAEHKLAPRSRPSLAFSRVSIWLK